ncbi:MAG: glycerol kinase GlpK [Actinomycetota bacterium]|nr:glycerol kinase GlpK [Actinomycetota bacterium]
MKKKYVLAIDQGTSGSRVILFDYSGRVLQSAHRELKQFFPNPGWVEHDPLEYIDTTLTCLKEVIQKCKIDVSEIASIGIANQRETIILWDKETGKPVYNAIVWQCRRTADYCSSLKENGYDELINEKTGLVIDAYFSATKIKWIIDNVAGVKEKIKQNKILAGNVDSWLIWNLSKGKYHVTDYSNASRTLLLNINTLNWDDELLKLFDIPACILPKLKPSSGVMAYTDKNILGIEIAIAGDAGDQQAALFGQACFRSGMAKNTYGTALAVMMNIGDKPIKSKNGLLTDLAWVIKDKATYAFEGIIFNGGSTIQWLRDGIKIINDARECDILSEKVEDTGNVYLVPAFTGLCVPYWDMYARGIIIGITRGTTREHICRAAEEAIAYQTADAIYAMISDSSIDILSMRVDGGATKSDFLLQFQSDILGINIERPKITEMTALGAAYLAGLGAGFWDNMEELEKQWEIDKIYKPSMDDKKRKELYAGWKNAVQRSLAWAK